MSYADIGNAIRQKFFDEITAGGDGGTAIVTSFPNIGCIDSTESQVDQPTTGVWCELSLQFGSADQAELGADPLLETRTGVLFVAVRGPQGTGEFAIDALVDRVFDAFRRLDISGVTFRGHSQSGRFVEGPWWKETLQLSWFSNVSTTAAT